MVKNISLYGDPILTRISKPIEKDDFGDELEEFILDMIDTLKHHGALGLAAPQIGVSKRILIVSQTDNPPLVFINPSIIENSKEIEMGQEGCLSVPGVICEIPRFRDITIKYLDIEGIEAMGALTDLEARIFQHEFDHLNGREMLYYLTPVRRGLIEGKLKKILKYRKFLEKNSELLDAITDEHTETHENETHKSL